MNVKETRVFRGPNFYSRYHTVIRLTIDLEELEDYPSDMLGDFNDRLITTIPSLHNHRCSLGEPGGFITRLRRGTWMGHIIEHIALELQTLAGTRVTFGKARGTGTRGVYFVIIEYLEEKVGLAAIELACNLVRSLMPPHLPSAMPEDERAQFNFEEELLNLIRLADKLALGPSTNAIVRAAEKRNIPWMRLNEQSLVQLGYGKYQKRIRATITSKTSQIATDIASDKRLTNQMLFDAGVPVPRQFLVSSEDEAVEAALKLKYPVVIKPLDLSHGRGASLNLITEEMVREGFLRAREVTRGPVIVETFLKGNDYRLLIVNDRMVAAAQRIPGRVVGDGVHTVRELLDIVNADPRRGVSHEKELTRIVLDAQAEKLMKKAGVTVDTVLPKGERLYLRSTANMSTGGTAVDVTEKVHYETMELARRAARIVGLDVAGIDIISPDISKPLREVGGGIVEVNAAPGFRMHVAPTEGQPRDVAGPVLDMLFPPGRPSRIPIAAITGTNGKTTTTLMVGHILKVAGYYTGVTTTDGVYIDGQRYLKGDMTGPWSARMVLRDPNIEAAVLETARGGILREGLGFDQCDVGAVLNVTSDHLGLRGVDTLEQLADAKSLVVGVVSKDGYAVLNADDPLVVKMAERTPGKPFYFTMSGRNRLVKDHISEGGSAAVLEKSMNGYMITIYDEHRHIPVVLAHQIPATLDGRAKFNIANALAAAAIAYAMGVAVRNIRQGLQTFATTYHQVPGRMNIFDECGFRVIVDYAHNQAALTALGELVRTMRHPHKIGVVAAPGDRRDEDLRSLGEIAAGIFDEIILKEGADRRGRPPGETAGLLRDGAIRGGMPASRITMILSETEAVDAALNRAKTGELVAIFCENVHNVWDQVTNFNVCEKPNGNSTKKDRSRTEQEKKLEIK